MLVFDEMKIREDLVFNKSIGEVTGYIDYGEGSLDQGFVELREQCVKQRLNYNKVATHMLNLISRSTEFSLNVIIHWHTFLLKVLIIPVMQVVMLILIRGAIRIPDLHCVVSHQNVDIVWCTGNQHCC